MTSSAWDRRLAARAASLAGVTSLVVLLVIVTTDDGASWARRAAMWGAIAPVAGAIGTLGAVRLAEARGELLALFAIGARPGRARLGAVIGGIALALVGPCVAGSRFADLSALFPRLVEVRVWLPDGGEEISGDKNASESDKASERESDKQDVALEGSPRISLRETTMGIRVEASGRITFLERRAIGEEDASRRDSAEAPALSRGAGAAAIAALALSAIACPIWIAAGSSSVRKIAVGLAALAALIAAFQAVAMGRGGPLLLLGAPLLLLADVLAARYRASRSA